LTRQRALVVLPLALALAAPGCELPGSDTTSDGGCADDAGQKVGDQCTTVYTELCKQASRCNISITSVTDCATSDVAQYCCTGSACSAWSCQAPSQVSACTADIDNEDCNAIVTNQTPSDCAPFTTAM
jgi:hypothetical protein